MARLLLLTLAWLPRATTGFGCRSPSVICTSSTCPDPGDPGFRNNSSVSVSRSNTTDSIELLWKEDVWRPQLVRKIILLGEEYTDLRYPVVIETTEPICYSKTVQVQYTFTTKSEPLSCYSTTYEIPVPPMEEFFSMVSEVTHTKVDPKHGDLYDIEFLKNQILVQRYKSCLQSVTVRKADRMSFLLTNFTTGRQQVEIPLCGSVEVEYRFLTTTTSKTVRGDCDHTEKVQTQENERFQNSGNSQISPVVIFIGYGLIGIICALVVALVHMMKSQSRRSAETGDLERRRELGRKFGQVPEVDQDKYNYIPDVNKNKFNQVPDVDQYRYNQVLDVHKNKFYQDPGVDQYKYDQVVDVYKTKFNQDPGVDHYKYDQVFDVVKNEYNQVDDVDKNVFGRYSILLPRNLFL